MTATTETRKRTREDDGSDSMPLSKRINNLHINNNTFNFHNEHNASHHTHENGPANNGELMSYHNVNGFGLGQSQMQQNSPENFYHNSESSSNEENVEQFHNNQGMMEQYNPELDQQQNPYYYNKNKLLFELHAERLRRTHQ